MNPAATKRANETLFNKDFVCVVIANFLLCVGHFSVNPLIATYAQHLGAAPVIMGLLTGMFFGVSLAMRPVSGPMITKIDKRKLLIVIFALGGVVNLGYALFHTMPLFILFRVLNGVQYSFIGSLIMTAAGDSIPEEKLASGMGIYGVGGAVGTALGPAIADQFYRLGIAQRGADLGFTYAFLFAASALALAVIPSAILSTDKKSKEAVDSTGAWYRNIVTVHAFPMAFIMFFVISGYAIINSYVFNFGGELHISNISFFYTAMAAVLVLSRPVSGYLSDRIGVAKVIIPGMCFFAVSFLVIGYSTTLGVVLLGGAVAALGIGSTQPAIQAMCMQSVEPLKRSVASNTIYIGMDLGFFLGPLMGGIIYDRTSSYAFMFKVTLIPIIIALISFIVILPAYNRRRSELQSEANKL